MNTANHLRRHISAIRFFFLVEVVVVVVCAFLLPNFENHALSRMLARFYLETAARLPLESNSPRVLILDISGIDQVTNRYGMSATSRTELFEVLQKLNVLGAKRVGVDIDFSLEWIQNGKALKDRPASFEGLSKAYTLTGEGGPPVAGSVSKGLKTVWNFDLAFFDAVLQLRSNDGMEVYLGVDRQAAQPRSAWFSPAGDSQLGMIGGTIASLRETTALMPVAHRIHGGEEVPTLAAALAASEPNRIREDFLFHDRLAWGSGDDVAFQSVVIDYSPMERFDRMDLTELDDAYKVRADTKIRGRTVLVGYLKDAGPTDRFTVPGRKGKSPGLLLHASAYHTLVKAPRHVLSHSALILFEIVLFFAIAALTAVSEFKGLQTQSHDSLSSAKWWGQKLKYQLAVVLALLATFVVGVHWFRVLILDLFLLLTIHLLAVLALAAWQRLHESRLTHSVV